MKALPSVHVLQDVADETDVQEQVDDEEDDEEAKDRDDVDEGMLNECCCIVRGIER